MLLTLDVGNTNTNLGVFEGETLKMTARLNSDKNRTPDEYASYLKNIFEIKSVNPAHIDGAVISSVVPAVGAAISNAVEILCSVTPIMLGPGVKTGLNIKIDNPGQLGADLAAGAVAATRMYELPCIIFDLGTATTMSVIDKNGVFRGGAIAAGLRTTLDALAGKTSLLPMINIEAPQRVIGTNTVDSMQSGLVYGAAAMLDGMIRLTENELGEKATVIATGGLGAIVVPLCEREIIYNPNLLFHGMRFIYSKNK